MIPVRVHVIGGDKVSGFVTQSTWEDVCFRSATVVSFCLFHTSDKEEDNLKAWFPMAQVSWIERPAP